MDERNRTRSDADAGAAENDDGFTLIELMVVVLVIAILLAIAVPTFLGARERSQDRAAQSSLRNALTAAKVAFVDSGDYDNAESTDLKAIEPSLTFNASTVESEEDNTVSVYVSTDDTIWAAAAQSESGSCFYIKDDSDEPGTTGGTKYGSTTAPTAGTCDGDAAKAVALIDWLAS